VPKLTDKTSVESERGSQRCNTTLKSSVSRDAKLHCTTKFLINHLRHRHPTITKGKVLGCLVSTKGIEANPDKIRAITQMQPPQSRKNVQKLTGRIASLNWFISKLAERSLPFFTALRGSLKIQWGVEQQKAFERLKSYLQELPTLSSPEKGQPLILYVSATLVAVSGALVVEKEIVSNGKPMKQQFPVYFMSEALTGSKRFYS
jgi:hypothetical protein